MLRISIVFTTLLALATVDYVQAQAPADPAAQTSAGPTAQASAGPAAQAFSAGSEAFAREDYKAAVQSFMEANQLSPSAAATYNLARSYEALGYGPRAADSYAAALRLTELDMEQKKHAQRQLQKLRRKLGVLRVDAEKKGTVSIAHLKDKAVPVEVHLSPGRYELSFTDQNGTLRNEQVELIAGESFRMRIAEKKVIKQAKIEGAKEIEKAPVVAFQDSSVSTWKRPLGWSLVGVAAAGGVAGVFTGAFGIKLRNDFVDSGRTDIGLRDRSRKLRLATNLTWAIAGVSAAAAIWVLLVDRKERKQRKMKLSPGGVHVAF